MRENEEVRNDIIIGRNPVGEAVSSGREIESIYVAKGNRTGSIVGILAKAKKRNIVIKDVDIKKLDFMAGHSNHQGIIATVSMKEYSSIDDIFEYANEKNEKPFIIVLDCIEDPHNLGAIIRSAECAGAHGVIIKSRNAAGLSYSTMKASAGALEYMRVAKVNNISNAVEELKKKGCWVFAADMNGEDYTECDFSGSIALVVGNEGKGISRLVREKCDTIVSLPLKGKINSLNASVAAGILMYKIIEKR